MQPTGAPVDDVAYLVRSEHRVAALVAMRARPRTRSELQEATGVSASTIRRTLSAFERRNWIRRTGYTYRTTALGAYVADAVAVLLDRLETERTVRDVWQWLPEEDSGFAIEMCADAVVTVAEANDPYGPANRFFELLRTTDRFQFVGSDLALLEPRREAFCHRIIDGLRAEVVGPGHVARYIRRTYPELFSKTLASGNLTARLAEELPSYAVGIFDDRVAVCGLDPDSVSARVLVDTDDEAARRWAAGKFTVCWDQSRPLPEETPAR